MTETSTRPDPQVVAWMRDYLRAYPYAIPQEMVDAYLGEPADLNSWPMLRASAEAALRKPLTVADIPAGQGPASLYVDPDGTIRYRDADGRSRVVLIDLTEHDAGIAALEYLAATLPTIEETP